MTYAKSAIIILVKRGRRGVVTEYTKPRGKAIQELTFKTIKEWQKHIK